LKITRSPVDGKRWQDGFQYGAKKNGLFIYNLDCSDHLIVLFIALDGITLPLRETVPTVTSVLTPVIFVTGTKSSSVSLFSGTWLSQLAMKTRLTPPEQ
jgi:hypothetical protein